MICMELGELYGFDTWEELWQAIKIIKSMGMSDEEINIILERSKTKKGECIRMLWEEGEKYTILTGEDWRHTPINKMGAYLDGYDKGMEVLDKIRSEIESECCITVGRGNDPAITLRDVFKIIDKYKEGK